MIADLPDLSALPAGWSARTPAPEDVPALVALMTSFQRATRGFAAVDTDSIESWAAGVGSWTRRQVVLTDPDGAIVAWASVHDRAAGRTMIDLTVGPDCPEADAVASILLPWIEAVARDIARLRELEVTQLDASPYSGDERLTRWLTEAGYSKKRTWLQMSRRIDDAAELGPPREGVTVRRVAKHESGLPVAQDLQVVHLMLEESFADHFNSYRESFPEFVQRLREDPGHRWDHWWIAEVETDGEVLPGGALVASVLPEDESGCKGSYVDYIGVHQRARGRGVAKALLATVIRDAHDRGRNRVDLEVDADSPTGADGLYESMGWETKYRTESWHKDCEVGAGEKG